MLSLAIRSVWAETYGSFAAQTPFHVVCSLLEGKSGVGEIDRFDASAFPTKFAAQIKNFSSDGCDSPVLCAVTRFVWCEHLWPCQHCCLRRLIDRKNERRYDDCIKYTIVASKKALIDGGLSKDGHADAFEKLDKERVGVLVGSGMGGLQVFQDGVTNLVQKVSALLTAILVACCGALEPLMDLNKGSMQLH
jgi:3-oxoacyl-[acyl-carrier-protein] synthase II